MSASRPPRRRGKEPRRRRIRTRPTIGGPASAGPVQSPQDVVKARSPADILALVPFLLGFHPTDSLVVVALERPRSRVGLTIRVDLPPEAGPVDDLVAHLVATLVRNRVREVLLVAYADRADRSDPLTSAMLRALHDHGIAVRDGWRTAAGRWFSLVCADPECCPAAGTAYDPATTVTSAHAVYSGVAAAPDREALRATIDRLPASGVQMERATDQALTLLVARLERASSEREWTRSGMLWIAALVERFVAAPRRLSDDECARISVWVKSVHVRDVAWSMIGPQDIDAHVDLWTQVTRRAIPGFVAGPASLLGFVCWLRGDSALARLAIERALADRCDYSIARLIEHLLNVGLPPTEWVPFPVAELFAAMELPPRPAATPRRR